MAGSGGSMQLFDAGPPRATDIVIATIGPDGGTLSIPGVLTLTVPPGALASPTQLSVQPSGSRLFGGSALSAVYVFEPIGTQFTLPAQLDFFVPPAFATLATGATIRWGPTVDTTVALPTQALSDRFRAEVSHFTVGYLSIPPPTGGSTATCQVRGGGQPTSGCSGVDASVPEPYPSEIALTCSAASPVRTVRPRAHRTVSGLGVGHYDEPGFLAGVYYRAFSDAGVPLSTTPPEVTGNRSSGVWGSDFAPVPDGSGDLWFAYRTNAARPGDPPQTPRGDLFVARTNAAGVLQGTTARIFNDQLCPPANDAGTPGAPSAAFDGRPPLIVTLPTGPVIAWLERWTIGCQFNGGVLIKVRAVWLNNDLSVRAGPMDLTEMYTEIPSEIALGSDGQRIVALAYASTIRRVPAGAYPEASIALRTFVDGVPTTTGPTLVAGHPCPDRRDPYGRTPAMNINLPDGGFQCLGTVTWSGLTLAIKPGLAVVGFNTSGGGLHLAAHALQLGPWANQPLLALEYTGAAYQRPALTATDTGYALAGFINTAYGNGAELSYFPVDGGTQGAGLLFMRLTDTLQFYDSPTLVGLGQFGVRDPPSVASRGLVSVVSWADAPNPTMGAGATRLRQKAAVLTCPP